MTIKELVIQVFNGNKTLELTCAEIFRKTEIRLGSQDSLSSMLRKMVDDGVLQYGKVKGPRGGKTYKLI